MTLSLVTFKKLKIGTKKIMEKSKMKMKAMKSLKKNSQSVKSSNYNNFLSFPVKTKATLSIMKINLSKQLKN